MEIFEGVASVAGGVGSTDETLKSIEIFQTDQWTLHPDGMTLEVERSRFFKVFVSRYYIKIPT
jgi:hypothetical protein